MKKEILITGMAFLALGVCATSCSNRTAITTVQAAEATALVSKKNLVILDVRTPQEFAEGHLPGAVNIDFLHSSFKDRISQLGKKKKYLVYCRSGHRSTQAADIMHQLGFKQVTNMTGGIMQWQGPVIK